MLTIQQIKKMAKQFTSASSHEKYGIIKVILAHEGRNGLRYFCQCLSEYGIRYNYYELMRRFQKRRESLKQNKQDDTKDFETIVFTTNSTYTKKGKNGGRKSISNTRSYMAVKGY